MEVPDNGEPDNGGPDNRGSTVLIKYMYHIDSTVEPPNDHLRIKSNHML